MDDPVHTHEWEQFMATVTEMAVAMAHYRQQLEDAGFAQAEALYLVAQLQKSLLGRGR